MKYDLKAHLRSNKTTFKPKSFYTFVYGLILIKICMNATIMKTQFFIKLYVYDLKYQFYFMEKFCYFFTVRPSELITTLTNILIDNFYTLFFFAACNLKDMVFFIGCV